MTPTERRDTLAVVIGDTMRGNLGEPTTLLLSTKAADALMPKVEEWLGVAWDEGYAAMGDESRPIGEPIVNPYRRDKT